MQKLVFNLDDAGLFQKCVLSFLHFHQKRNSISGNYKQAFHDVSVRKSTGTGWVSKITRLLLRGLI
jgi:hypothetical protein